MSENLEKSQKLLDVSFELRLARTAMRDFSNLNLKRGPVEPGNNFINHLFYIIKSVLYSHFCLKCLLLFYVIKTIPKNI